MYSGEVKSHFKKRVKNLVKELLTPDSKRKTETFHRLRVEIKKIRAIYSLISFTNKNFPGKKYMEPIKKIYKYAGKVRETQIHENLLTSLNADKNKQLINSIKKERSKYTSKFEKATNKELLAKIEKIKDHVSEYLAEITSKEIAKYNKRAIAKIQNISKVSIEEDKLHKCRRQLKEFLYNFRFSFPKEDSLIVNIDKIQETIGLWHDNDETINYLNKLINTNKLVLMEESNIKTMSNKLLNKNKMIYRQINRQRLNLKKNAMKWT